MAVQALCVRETVKVGLTARPALAEERASSSRPSWARAAAKLRVCDQIISADFDRSSKPRDCAVITCREASSHSLQNSSMYGHWYRSGRGARPRRQSVSSARTTKILPSPIGHGRAGKDSIQHQRAFTFGDALRGAFGQYLDTPQQPVAAGVVWNGRRGLANFPSAYAKAAVGSGTNKFAPLRTSRRPIQSPPLRCRGRRI
jgi:hypothetical protein